ncbi:T9SS type A sorting domain-containing protein [Nonlabens ponticola]|uniref:T9SS type A sorting domain-containing protein n=1 Tax=Nonlabens ponticola TaxID=2496866 RepID=A0A3S9MX58_9FLAO|nr:T9SS type A sorting domain-containing protein [Nonlabens ponticola]AZQ43770.1 T9SS type A sorting domain-containing protein [Nonlabens ponticola]
MKNITIILVALFTTSLAMAQVQVNNNAFIYSKGTDIVVKQGIVLRDAPDEVADTPGSAIYMRDEAQLIQLEPNATANGGAGTFSVFQEGVADNFTYNYWSAPVNSGVGFSNTQIYYPLLMEGFARETDLVIDANRARLYERSRNDGRTDEQDFTNPSTESGPTIVTKDLRIASRWLYSYNSVGDGSGGGGGYSGWQAFADPTAIVLPGYGFTMKGVLGTGPNIESSELGSGQRYDFRGIPNSGDITVGVKAGDFSLVGNPYPSALDLKTFLLENTEISAEAYFWDSQPTTHKLVDYEGGYGVYTPGTATDGTDGMYENATFRRYDSSGEPLSGSVGRDGGITPVGNTASRRYAAIGQGFVIQRNVEDGFTLNTDGYATFKNSHRVFVRENPTSSLFKSAPGSSSVQALDSNGTPMRSRIKINAFINGQYNRSITLAFGDDSTIGWDRGLEGSNAANRVATDMFMPLANNEFVIQTVPFNKEETDVPLGFASQEATSTFDVRVYDMINFDTEDIFIHDKLNNTYHDILNDSFEITVEKGTFEDRYSIVFEEQSTLSNDDVLANEDSFNIFQNNTNATLTVLNRDMQDVADISIYDLAGRLITSESNSDLAERYTFNTSNYAAGIYIVRVTTQDEQEISTKVSVSN